MSDLSPVEKRVFAVLAVAGNVSRQNFNELCNILNIHSTGRDKALQSLRDKRMINKYTVRYAGDTVNSEAIAGWHLSDDVLVDPGPRYGKVITADTVREVYTHPFANVR